MYARVNGRERENVQGVDKKWQANIVKDMFDFASISIQPKNAIDRNVGFI